MKISIDFEKKTIQLESPVRLAKLKDIIAGVENMFGEGDWKIVPNGEPKDESKLKLPYQPYFPPEEFDKFFGKEVTCDSNEMTFKEYQKRKKELEQQVSLDYLSANFDPKTQNMSMSAVWRHKDENGKEKMSGVLVSDSGIKENQEREAVDEWNDCRCGKYARCNNSPCKKK